MSEENKDNLDKASTAETIRKSIATKAEGWVKAWENLDPKHRDQGVKPEGFLDKPTKRFSASDYPPQESERSTKDKFDPNKWKEAPKTQPDTPPGQEAPPSASKSFDTAAPKTKFESSSWKADSWVQSTKPFDPERIKREDHKVDTEALEPVVIEESKIRKRFTRFFFVAFTLFGVWAVYAPIDGGVTASGTVVVSGYRKVVQYPLTGVVREILVSEGDEVTEGQTLIRVNPLTLQASLGTIESDLINVLASEARLKAERLNTAIKWPALFSSLANQPQVAEAKVTQEALLKARRHEYVETMRARNEQLKSLIKEEKNLGILAEEGLVPKANAEQAMRNRLESENLINAFTSNFFKQTEVDLAEAQKRRESLQLQLEAAKFDEEKASILSPIGGVILGLKVVTVGGVITGGQVLAEVVPKDSKLVVDVKLPANVIDRVKKDAVVDLHFTAFNAATTPTVPGRLIKVGTDRQLPDKTKPGEPDFEYYSAQVETTPEGMQMLGKLNIQPGMPVDVVIKTGTRSFLSYMMKPISDRVIWAFKS